MGLSFTLKIWERGVAEKLEETPPSQERAFCRETPGADDTGSWENTGSVILADIGLYIDQYGPLGAGSGILTNIGQYY